MVKINITSPTKCYLEKFSQEEFFLLKKELTYNNTNAMFNLKKLKENKWLQYNRPDIFEARAKEIEAKLVGCMLQYDPEVKKYWFYPGSLSFLEESLNFEISTNIKYPKPKKIPWRKPPPFDLYPYQKESVERLMEAKHACVELCTGAGKSLTIFTLTRELGLKTVIVTPSKSIFIEILEQAEHYFGKSMVGAYGDGKKRLDKQITVCVSKSLTMLKPGTKEYDFFKTADVVIGDECHTLGADTLENVFHGVLQNVPYRFFLSGTITRGDGKGKLLDAIVGKKVHELTARRAIEGGYICPVNFIVFETLSPKKEDFSDPLKSKREHFLYNDNVADIVAKIAHSAEKNGESTLVLVEELIQIKMLTDRLQIPYGYAHSASKAEAAKYGLETVKPNKVVESFNLGEFKLLIGTSCISTGTNIYPTHNTVNWVGGTSEVKTKQGAVGRSVRLLEKSPFAHLHKPKPFSKIFDFSITNKSIMVRALQKRLDMYKETGDNFTFIKG